MEFEVPNLDGLDESELVALEKVFSCLGRYTHSKVVAMRYRVVGAIEDALNVERYCDQIYKELPDWARW